jgi:hypothetical protein
VDADEERPVMVDGDAYVDAADDNIKRLRLDETQDVVMDGIELQTEPEDT